MSVRLRVEPVDGPAFDHELAAGVVEVVIGRGAAAGLVVADASVSRQHARLFKRDGRWWVEDLGARNRTCLNEKPIEGAASLRAGDALRLGHSVLRFLGEPAVKDGDEATGNFAVPGLEPVFLKTTFTRPDTTTTADAEGDRQAARLQMLNEVHRALATAISLEDLLALILERSFAVLRPEEGVILLKAANGTFEPAASRRRTGEAGDIFVSRRIVEEVAGKGQSALVLDAAMDERFAGSHSIIASGVRSVVAAPLVDAEGTIGMIALYSRVSVRQFSQEDLDLLVSLASAAALRVRNVALAEEAAARQVLERELSLAHEMQMAMLPRQLPERPEVALSAALKPARSVGGDLYDFVLEGDRLWFIVGDVSGKGVAAALYMAVAKTLFRATALGHAAIPEVLGRMNRELCRDNERSIFVTAVVGHLTLSTGDLVLGDAGHNLAMLIGRDGRLQAPALTRGVALGVVEDFEYVESAVPLGEGGTLLLFTDGVTDARNTAGDQFGSARLERALVARAGQLPEALVGGVLGEVETFAAGAPPEDDITLLALRYRGKTP